VTKLTICVEIVATNVGNCAAHGIVRFLEQRLRMEEMNENLIKPYESSVLEIIIIDDEIVWRM